MVIMFHFSISHVKQPTPYLQTFTNLVFFISILMLKKDEILLASGRMPGAIFILL